MYLHEDLVLMETAVTNLVLNKPVYVGFSVLDLSKLLMYQFHYQKMLPLYPNKINLCFTDTDSLLYEIGTPYIYADMHNNADDYDFSAYPFDHPCYSPKHYQKARTELATISVKQNQIKSVNHQLGTYHQTRVALTGFDTKRWM